MSEFERMFDAARLPAAEQALTATAPECAALAERFCLPQISSLTAKVQLLADGDGVRVTGRLQAAIVQSCAISGEDVPVRIDEPVALHFVRSFELPAPDAEIELTAEELDQIEMDGTRFDLGEAVAQTLALAIDPYLEGPGADQARRQAGIATPEQTGPFAALKGLLKSDEN